jgi:plasmid replication initiation protein
VLVNAAYAMPLHCKRLIALGLSKISYLNDDMGDEAFAFTVTAREWKDAFSTQGGRTHQQMEAAAVALMGEHGVLWYKMDDGRKEGRHWFSRCTYIPGRGVVKMQFDPEIRANLKDLRRGDYTDTDLAAVCTLGSIYSIRLYELCRQYRDKGFLVRSIVDYRRMFKLEDSYKEFNDLKKRVIQRSVDEINKNMLLGGPLNWEPRRSGTSKVTGLKFIFPRQGVLLNKGA